jgi:hypothetical protein
MSGCFHVVLDIIWSAVQVMTPTCYLFSGMVVLLGNESGQECHHSPCPRVSLAYPRDPGYAPGMKGVSSPSSPYISLMGSMSVMFKRLRLIVLRGGIDGED